MPRKPQMLKDFSRYTDSEFDDFAQGVIDDMTDNADFPTPQPALDVLQDAKDAYSTALGNADGGGVMETEIKDVKRKALDTLLKQEADYVELASEGDAVKIMSAGFKMSKTPQPAGERPKPGNLRVTSKAEGQLNCRCNPVENAKMYEWQIRKVDSTDAPIVKQTSAAKLLLTGLESGKRYAVKVVSLGTNEIKNWSDEIGSVVL